MNAEGLDCFLAEETRPLSIGNTANRLLASAYRLRWEPLLAPRISPYQRGFLPGRSMLRNVVEVEHDAMMAALEREDAALVLFDFKAAFPSVSRTYLLAALESAGLPPCAMAVVRTLYMTNTAQLVLHGGLHGSIALERGIRQGCPLSPLLFALASDALLRVLQERHPDCPVAAFADDTAMVISSWSRQARAVFRTFEVFRAISALELNMAKTVGIPLWLESPEQVAHRFAETNFPQISWKLHGRYLGFQTGPGKGRHSWSKPEDKYTTRLREWPWSELGLHHSIAIYNIYILTTLLFVGQLEVPDATTVRLEYQAVHQLAPGAGDWISARDLQHGRQLGLSAALRSVALTCKAAMLRTFFHETAEDGGYWKRLARSLKAAQEASEYVDRRAAWDSWFTRHAATVVQATADEARALGWDRNFAYRDITRVPVGPLSPGNLKRARRAFKPGCMAASCAATSSTRRTDSGAALRGGSWPASPGTRLHGKRGTWGAYAGPYRRASRPPC